MYLEYTPLTELLLPYYLLVVYFCIGIWAISQSPAKPETPSIAKPNPPYPETVFDSLLDDVWLETKPKVDRHPTSRSHKARSLNSVITTELEASHHG